MCCYPISHHLLIATPAPIAQRTCNYDCAVRNKRAHLGAGNDLGFLTSQSASGAPMTKTGDGETAIEQKKPQSFARLALTTRFRMSARTVISLTFSGPARSPLLTVALFSSPRQLDGDAVSPAEHL